MVTTKFKIITDTDDGVVVHPAAGHGSEVAQVVALAVEVLAVEVLAVVVVAVVVRQKFCLFAVYFLDYFLYPFHLKKKKKKFSQLSM